MPNIDSNIPQNIFDSKIKGEFLTIARSTFYLDGFIPKSKEPLDRMDLQGSKFTPFLLQLKVYYGKPFCNTNTIFNTSFPGMS